MHWQIHLFHGSKTESQVKTTGGLRISDEQQFLLSAVDYSHGWQRCRWMRKNCCFTLKDSCSSSVLQRTAQEHAVVPIVRKSLRPLFSTAVSIANLPTLFVLESGEWKSTMITTNKRKFTSNSPTHKPKKINKCSSNKDETPSLQDPFGTFHVLCNQRLRCLNQGKLENCVAQCLLPHALKYYSVARTERTAVRHVFLVYSFKQRFLV